jgi:acid stress chaperone HdeB
MKPPLTLAASALAAALCAATPAHAQTLDLSTVKCKDFVSGAKENIGLILMWVAGYYSDEDAPPVVDFDKMKTDGQKLSEYCAKHPDDGIITAAEEVIAQQVGSV